ncbi:diguanylate cyclase [Alkalilimnicola sp. S0819]|uniref:diguanylate cyclase n=1 Tax=Alkalilimnicola sp. S0819 TaxID=2613922 RepID=UPI00126174BD|nr:diguanylate cyclase [Alkalilimnicola sp. S0819]KAB7623412.1 diguanylate cyclase [Alkalilimnicola sp. S0819]MPQ16958.1 diguanylate cyclase [Alkalilimnicola sp. S0819]
MHTSPNRFQQLALSAAVVLALVTALGGLLALLSWWLPSPALRLPAPGAMATGVSGGLGLALTGIAVALGWRRGAWQRLSRIGAALVLLLALWSLCTAYADWPSIDWLRPLPLPTAFAFLFLAVSALSLATHSRLRMAVTGVAAMVALLISAYKLAAYGSWLYQPEVRMLLLALPPQTAALQGLLALSLLGHFVHAYRRPPGRTPTLVMASYALMAALCALAWAHFIQVESRVARAEPEQLAANVSRVLEEHVYRSLDPIELIFGEVARQVASDGLDTLTRSARQWRALSAMTDALPQVSALLMLDEQGDMRWFSRQFPAPGGNYRHRAYFRAHQAGQRRHLGELIIAGTNKKRIFTYSLRLTDEAGRFAGVVLASLEIGYFQSFYRSLDLGPGAALGLWRRDGRLLMREPLLDDLDAQQLDQHPIYTSLIHQRAAGSYVGHAPTDGKQKLAYYLASDELPFVVNTVMPLENVIAPFQRRFLQATAILALILAMLAVMMLLQLRTVARTVRRHEQTRQQQRFTQAVLDSVSSAIAIVSPEGRIVGVNAAWERFKAESGDHGPFIDRDYLGSCESGRDERPEVAVRVAEGLGAVLAGEAAEFEHIYPRTGAAGDEQWYRMKVLPMRDSSGRAVVSHEPVTALQAAANTDPLTGLSNRRALVELAAAQLANAHRHQHPLSLMMIDYDHFKRVNDSHGHAAGDAVLRELAQLMRATCRSGDLPGRLGGEEFVAVLPHASAEGALVLAERLREAVERKTVVHNGAEIRATVSIGVATLQPGMDFEDLLALADEALYRAKAGGRNRVVHGAAAPEPPAARDGG